MSKLFYSLHGKLVALQEEEVLQKIVSVEDASRSGKFAYVDLVACQAQVDDMKVAWPDVAKAFVKTEAKRLAGTAAISPLIIHRAMIETCRNLVAVERSKHNHTDPKAEFAYMSGDIALSSLFKRAPDASLESTPRKFGLANKTIRVKSSSNPRRLVIDEEKLAEADFYVQALFLKDQQTSVLMGWASQEQLRSAPKDNKTTNEKCNWTRMAYHLLVEQLRPMSEMLVEFGIKEVPKGILFESVPSLKDIPLMASVESQHMLTMGEPKKESYEQFMADCGFVDIKPAEKKEGLEL